MRGIFCNAVARNNEEYRKIIRKRRGLMLLLVIVGIITAAVAFLADMYGLAGVPDHALGIYSGAGAGLAVAGFAGCIRCHILLRNENKLKERRLKESDERLIAIGGKAIQAGLIAMLVVLYAGGLIGSIFYPVFIYALAVVIGVFLITYIIAYYIYERKM